MVKAKTGTDLALRDKQLIEAAANGYSGEEMEAKYGVPAAQAIVRVRELLSARDVWDEIEQRKLLLHSAFRVKEELEDYGFDAAKPKEIEAYLKVIKTLSDMLDKQGRITDSELQTITRAQAFALMQLVEAGYYRARDLLVQEYGMVIDIKEIDAAFREGLATAAENE